MVVLLGVRGTRRALLEIVVSHLVGPSPTAIERWLGCAFEASLLKVHESRRVSRMSPHLEVSCCVRWLLRGRIRRVK